MCVCGFDTEDGADRALQEAGRIDAPDSYRPPERRRVCGNKFLSFGRPGEARPLRRIRGGDKRTQRDERLVRGTVLVDDVRQIVRAGTRRGLRRTGPAVVGAAGCQRGQCRRTAAEQDTPSRQNGDLHGHGSLHRGSVSSSSSVRLSRKASTSVRSCAVRVKPAMSSLLKGFALPTPALGPDEIVRPAAA